MFSAVYISTAVGAVGETGLTTLLEQCRRNNRELGLTGLLVYRSGRFLQTLEGPEQAVRTVMERIEADPRHEQVRVIAEGPIEERRFPAWFMRYSSVSEAEAKTIPGFTEFFSTRQAESQGSTERASLLLEWFRLH